MPYIMSRHFGVIGHIREHFPTKGSFVQIATIEDMPMPVNLSKTEATMKYITLCFERIGEDYLVDRDTAEILMKPNAERLYADYGFRRHAPPVESDILFKILDDGHIIDARTGREVAWVDRSVAYSISGYKRYAKELLWNSTT